MSYNFEELLGENFNGNTPATAAEVAAAEQQLKKELPDDFREFLRVTNGGEGYAFDTRTSPFAVVSVPFVGMELNYAKPLAPDFVTFLEKLG